MPQSSSKFHIIWAPMDFISHATNIYYSSLMASSWSWATRSAYVFLESIIVSL